jgi:hypothetical protein
MCADCDKLVSQPDFDPHWGTNTTRIVENGTHPFDKDAFLVLADDHDTPGVTWYLFHYEPMLSKGDVRCQIPGMWAWWMVKVTAKVK